MKLKIIALLLLYIPILTIGQIPRVQKLIDGKPCDTCFVKHDMSFSNILPYVSIGTYSNPQRLSDKLKEFKVNEFTKDEKASYSKFFESHRHIITDSIFRLVFVTENDDKRYWPIRHDYKNYDYKEVEILIEKNNKILNNWQILDKLPPVYGYQLNRFTDGDSKNGISEPWASTHQTDDIHLYYDDIITFTFRKSDTKEIIQTTHIKRILDKPKKFVYYQTQTNSKGIKESLQSFLNDPLNSDFIRNKDTTNSFELRRNNLGVLVFNSLEEGEEIEFTLDKQTGWKSIQKNGKSAFEHKFIILDNEDIPPGTNKTLYLRYKNQPETEIPITIRGVEDLTQTSIFKIIAGFMLASLLFGSWFYFKNKLIKKKLADLNKKNKAIETQLSLLSGQLNPHFLFNSLNAIQGTIMNKDFETANAYISDVASFMRRVMDDGKKEFISLSEELKLEEDYLQLENKRKPFTYTIQISPSITTNAIDFPPLLLQPILENAIRHGLKNEIVNPHIGIKILEKNLDLIFQITDNGKYWDVSKAQNGQGLSLTHKRISIYNEKLDAMKITMDITYQEGTLTRFTFKNWLA
ncbi:sensor histidine kinase [Sphingobacterium bovistauri]|uniref:Histidine kinase n=1 Tax=Sphingobacterium bovistauri TaxID=2781959 RepID=A0ABS7Z0N1_9SPHI|nr:histidine kinase [Sphingobacterium bovistauri]MCA5003724.1 histidine kinase [Sphingobacterium bovistauri]